MKISGIYSITNTKNNKIYYGSSNDCNHRWSQHKSNLNKNKHRNQHLQNSWNQYGKDYFVFKIEEKVSIKMLFQIEQQYLNWINIMPNSWFYNIGTDARCWNRGQKGKRKHSVESCKKISVALSGSKNPKFNSNCYVFKNKMTNEKFTGTRYDFYTKYNLIDSHVSNLINKKRKSHKKWILISQINN